MFVCLLEGYGGIIFHVCHTFICIYFAVAVFSTGLQKAGSDMDKVECRQRCGQADLIITILQNLRNTADRELLALNKL